MPPLLNGKTAVVISAGLLFASCYAYSKVDVSKLDSRMQELWKDKVKVMDAQSPQYKEK